jgi:hypothetical protein
MDVVSMNDGGSGGDQEVMRMVRPYKCCLSTMDVFSGSERTGSVEQRCTCCIPVLEVFGPTHQLVRVCGMCVCVCVCM